MRDIDPRERIIVALDCDGDRARELAGMLKGHARWLKVGMTLFYEEGPDIIRELRHEGFKIFIDLKLHDIPHQVEGAAASLADIGVDMMTLHASGGVEMMRAAVKAVEGLANRPTILAVTVLTSTDDSTLTDIGVSRSMYEQVIALARLARTAGCDGVVCSAHEAMLLRGQLGKDAAIVCPGIRPSGSAKDDQSRVATPKTALAAGASHLVIGRPITQAADPLAAFEAIADEIREV